MNGSKPDLIHGSVVTGLLFTLLICELGHHSARAQETDPASVGQSIVAAARAQIGVTTLYDPAYVRLDYPGGDPPADRGVCTDVLVRALRTGLNMDLQKEVHEDMRGHFSKYPANWGLRGPDKNIDHRRVPNLRVFFRRRGWALAVAARPTDFSVFLPGDVVTCIVPPNLPHVMVVSDRKIVEGRPLVIHNIGSGTREEDRLGEFELTGHYRIARRSGS